MTAAAVHARAVAHALRATVTALYRAAFTLAGAVAAVLAAFFVIGIGDGSVSSFNIGLWSGTLTTVGGILVGAHFLRARGHAALASLLLATLAVPGLLYALFMLLVIFSGARWN